MKLKLFAPTERYRTGAPPCMGLSENRVPLNPRVLSSVSLLELNFGGPNSQTHRGFYRDTRGLIGGLNEYDTCVYIYIYMCIYPTKNVCLINLTCFFTDLLSMVCDFMVLPPVCIFKRHLYIYI